MQMRSSLQKPVSDVVILDQGAFKGRGVGSDQHHCLKKPPNWNEQHDVGYLWQQEPATEPRQASDLGGQIDTIRSEGDDLLIRGWLWDASQPDRHLTLQISVLPCEAPGQGNGTPSACTAEVVANIYREDLATRGLGDGDHAFEHRLVGAADVAPGLVHLYCNETGQEFTCTTSTEVAVDLKRWPPVTRRGDGHLCGVSFDSGVLRGWVEHVSDGSGDGAGETGSRTLTILMDGMIVWTGLAQRRETVVRQGVPCEVRNGFLLTLPEPADTTTTIQVELVNDHGRHLAGSPMTLPYGDQYSGHVDVVKISGGMLEASGWCGNRRSPTTPVMIGAFYDGVKIAETEALLPRPDLQSHGFDPSINGFNLRCDLPDGFHVSRLAIRPERSGWPLAINAVQHGEEDPPVEVEQYSFGDPGDEISGSVDIITDRLLRGWARNKTSVGSTVVLDLFVNGILYATTTARRFRGDLKKHFGDHGCHEFLFELTQAVALDAPCKLEVLPRQGRSAINNKIPMLQRPVPAKKIIAPRDSDYLKRYRQPLRSLEAPLPSISLIVINRNGRSLLESFFSSFNRFNTYDRYEIVVVDHNSTDDSEELVEHWKEVLTIRWMKRPGNYSFSNSNNVAAASCATDLLLFVNNDVTFTMDTLSRVAVYMADPMIGCLGIRLLDDSPLKRPDRQSAVQHLGIHFDPSRHAADAFESRYAGAWEPVANELVEVPAVTGAYMVCRRHEFGDLGGFDEAYFYGHEDVDLALKYQLVGRRIVCANDVSALHMRAYSRDRMTSSQNAARQRNREVLEQRFGLWMRQRTANDRFSRPAFWSSTPIRVALIVTEATDVTLAGDYFTALEFAAQLSAQFPCECSFLETIAGNQFDLAGYDVVIAMRDDYNPAQIKNASSHLIRIAWVRNWFERFGNRPSALLFDRVWASSNDAVTYLSSRLDKPVQLMPIATNHYRFESGQPDPQLRSDYCFTGSYWGIHREIIQMLQPGGLPFDCAIYGSGWENVPHLAPYCRGSLPYRRMPEVYASTRLVIDDANHVTKSWGSVNSRVFDAIAAGALVITNGLKGSCDTFGGALPTYDTVQSLEALLWKYLNDEEARRDKVQELQKIVREQHTYRHRARTAWADFKHVSRSQSRIAIKIGAPTDKGKEEWGDWHFALSMKREFDRLGHTTRIDCLDAWETAVGAGDDLVIILRGLSHYRPKPGQINVMWCISHPNRISVAEYESYDHVFVASEPFAEKLQSMVQVPVSVLLQCTDPRLFNPFVPRLQPAPGVLFVGNSRNEYRRIVRDALAERLPLAIYGSRWEGFVPEHVVHGSYIDNAKLGSYYASAAVLLNDHWASMAATGFISNRLFDALACGARIISDDVPGLQALFGPLVRIYHQASDLPRLVSEMAATAEEEETARHDLADEVIRHHSFEVRVREIIAVTDAIRIRKLDDCREFTPLDAQA